MTTSSKHVHQKHHAVTTHDKGKKKLAVKIPLPCITILIHGVNDVGEAYEAQEVGLCKGLNARLNRAHSLNPNATGDLVPSAYTNPPTDPDITVSDPDKVYFRRTPDQNTWSPIIPFYWGFREETNKIKTDTYHGQWVDRYGNRLDKEGAKNGGPFANATSTLNDMWCDGFQATVGGNKEAAKLASKPTHYLVQARPRHYMLLAAKRLAMLIRMIHTKYPNGTAVNVLCHSQGSMVTLLANAWLAWSGEDTADTVIVQDPPYSLEEPYLETRDIGKDQQQTTQSRIDTLYNIVSAIHSKKKTFPALSDLVTPTGYFGADGVTGPAWKPGQKSEQMVDGQHYFFDERDNRGKFYLYFNPHDQTVSLKSVQGIGWQGVPDEIKADGPDGKTVKLPAFTRLKNVGFYQRMFTSQGIDGHAALLVGEPPNRYEAPDVKHPIEDKGIDGTEATSTARTINGEELNPKVKAVLTCNDGTGENEGKLRTDAIDADIAIASEGMKTDSADMVIPHTDSGDVDMKALQAKLPGQNPNPKADEDDRLQVVSIGNTFWNSKTEKKVTYTIESRNDARKRWQHKWDTNSDHSSIPANPAHAAGVTAYDVSLGRPLSVSEDDTAYLAYLCAVADWRTDWDKINKPKTDIEKKILAFQKADAEKKDPGVPGEEKHSSSAELLQATFVYHTTGVLPSDIAVKDQATMPIPSLIAQQTVAQREAKKK